jgi:hypothetical protein
MLLRLRINFRLLYFMIITTNVYIIPITILSFVWRGFIYKFLNFYFFLNFRVFVVTCVYSPFYVAVYLNIYLAHISRKGPLLLNVQ